MAMSTNPGSGGSDALGGLPTFDVTARKTHQWVMVALVAVGFVIGGPSGAIPLAVAGAIMLVGRFWWPADLVRQAVWRGLEPSGAGASGIRTMFA